MTYRTRTLTLLAIAILLILVGCAGSVAETAQVKLVTAGEIYPRLPADLQSGLILLDVRTPEEWAEGHIEGAILIPLDELPNRAAAELPQDAEIVVYCRSGNRSAQAAAYLVDAGYTNVSDLGGIIDWVAAGYPTVSGP